VATFIFNWSYTQQVKVGTEMAEARPINRGTIQGSGIGPTDFIVIASDLRALSRIVKKLFKYADDTTLLAPEHTDFSLEDEFMALKRWSESNNLLNTKVIVFHRPNLSQYIPPVPLSNI